MAAKGCGSEIDKYIAAFKAYDKNGDGSLSITEFRDLMRSSLNSNIQDSQIANFFVFLDAHGDNETRDDRRINLKEFTKGLDNIMQFRMKLKALFDQIDTDGSGHLSRAELTQLLKDSGMQCTEDEFAQIFREADRNNDNQISFDEFVNACT